MLAWTPAERRGALLVALLLALAAARDLWRAIHPVPAPEPVTIGSGGTEPDTPGPAAPGGPAVPVDLNRAGAAELDALPGIGRVLAGRILQYRAAHGPFRETDELMAVPGIGPRLIERLRPHVRVGRIADVPSGGTGRAVPGRDVLRRDPAIGNGGRADRQNPVQDPARSGR